MTFIDYYPNAKRALTTLEAMMITKTEYLHLKEISSELKIESQTNFPEMTDLCGFNGYFYEQIIRNSKFKNISSPKIEVIIANILLPDDKEVAKLLNNSEFSFDYLKSIIRFRSRIKNLVLHNADIDEDTEKQFKIYKATISRLIELFKGAFNIDNQTIILNRICEMLVTCPELFEVRRSDKIKKKDRL